MRLNGVLVSLPLLGVGLGCAGAEPAAGPPRAPFEPAPVESSPAQEPEARSAPAPAAVPELPKICDHTGSGGQCLPSTAFVNVLCDGVHADVALAMFHPGTPWTHGYLTRKTAAWNASGGASLEGELAFDEEVLILRERGAQQQGIQVSGDQGSYDALRWNGSCVSLAFEEVTFRKPSKPLYSRIEWSWLGDSMQTELLKDPQVLATYRARRNECKGVTMGAVSKKCEQLDGKLVDVVVEHVRGGGEIGAPKFP